MRSFALILLAVSFLGSAPSLSAEESAKPVKSNLASPATAKHKQKSPDKRTQSSKDKTSPKDQKPATTQQQDGPKAEPQNIEQGLWPPRTIGSWADLGMAVVTGAAVLVAMCTLFYIRKQVIANELSAGSAMKSAESARDAAKAALEEAKAITLSEQAYVFARVEIELFEPAPNDMVRILTTTWFINHGKTPAIIRNMTGNHYLRGAGVSEVPQEFSQTPTDDRLMSEGWVIASISQSPEGMKWPFESFISKHDFDAIKSGEKKLYCAGMIKYKDILGKERETGYCWELLRDPPRFKFCGASKLNYYDN